MAVTTFRVVEHLDVVEDITPCCFAVEIDFPANTLTLEELEALTARQLAEPIGRLDDRLWTLASVRNWPDAAKPPSLRHDEISAMSSSASTPCIRQPSKSPSGLIRVIRPIRTIRTIRVKKLSLPPQTPSAPSAEEVPAPGGLGGGIAEDGQSTRQRQ